MSRSDILRMMENHVKRLKLFETVLACEEDDLEKQKQQLIQKSVDLFQQLQRKQQQVKINYLAAPIVCIEFACKQLHINLDKDLAIKHTGLSPNDYNICANMAQNLLGLQFEISTADLCIKFGFPSVLSEQVDTLLQTFKTKFLESLKQTEQKQRANFNDSTFKAVALYIIVKQNRKTIDRDRLIQTVNSTQKKFDLLFLNMCSILEISLDSLLSDKPVVAATSNKTEITFKKNHKNHSDGDYEEKSSNKSESVTFKKRPTTARSTATKRKTMSLDENDQITEEAEEDDEKMIAQFVQQHKKAKDVHQSIPTSVTTTAKDQPNPKRLKQSTLSSFLV